MECGKAGPESAGKSLSRRSEHNHRGEFVILLSPRIYHSTENLSIGQHVLRKDTGLTGSHRSGPAGAGLAARAGCDRMGAVGTGTERPATVHKR